ncbi:hypothetical protein SAMN04488032_1167 [Pacificibacter marinus]|uniref:Uncharacterized protein n=1 Tax=Pacificibacter marinus TaxID=658057 RepID=A0A1Y5TM51_9RHOB|nr:hypothetical protein SAMN04488032_1167 [Pacificibacter marinus]SLN67292.1 hypothetical protein PAM7971_03563 [Pacificibacter marinus]
MSAFGNLHCSFNSASQCPEWAENRAVLSSTLYNTRCEWAFWVTSSTRLISGSTHRALHPSGDMKRGMSINQVHFSPTAKPPYKVGRLRVELTIK